MTELKPCPFCGNAFGEHSPDCFISLMTRLHAERSCGALISICDEQLVPAWNTRTERTCEMHRYRNALGLIDEWRCSECGADVSGIADDTPPNYCPNCGAKVIDNKEE